MRRQNQHCCTVYLLEQIYCWNLIASRPSSRKNTFDVCAFSARLTWNLFTVFISMNREKYAESLLKHVEDNKFLKFMISNNCSLHCRFFPLLRHFYISKNNFFSSKMVVNHYFLCVTIRMKMFIDSWANMSKIIP